MDLFKGTFSLTTLDEKPSFKVKFNKFVKGQRFHGYEMLIFNNMHQDPSMLRAPYRSRIGCLKAASSSADHSPPLRSMASRFTVANTPAACSPPITLIREVGHDHMKCGL